MPRASYDQITNGGAEGSNGAVIFLAFDEIGFGPRVSPYSTSTKLPMPGAGINSVVTAFT
jgi:hypothetical protein